MMHEFFPMFITQVWQVTLLAVVVWIVTKTFCKRRPHLGHALWLLVLIKCVVPPVFSSSTSVYSWILTDDRPSVVADRFVDNLHPKMAADPMPPIANSRPAASNAAMVRPTQIPAIYSEPTLRKTASRTPVTKIYTPVVPTSPPSQASTFRPQQAIATPIATSRLPGAMATMGTRSRTLPPITIWYSWIVKLWLGVAALALTITVLRYLRFRSWIRRQPVIEADDIEAQAQTLAKKLKLRRKIRVNVVDAEFGPAVIGLFRPTIVLPNTIVADQTAEQLESILGHELLHLRRGDMYWSVLQVVACSLMWFHPLVWLASRNVTRESEKCCDEETIANFQCDRANYARVLVDILEQKSRLRIAPVVPGVRPADITSSRLEQIMQSDNGTCHRTPRWIWALAFLIAFVVLPGAAIVQSQENGLSKAKAVTKDAPAPKAGFQSDDSRWQLASEPAQTPKTVPPPNRTAILQKGNAGNTFSPNNSRFNPGAAKAKFEAIIMEMCTDDEDEQKKIRKELEEKVWNRHGARMYLQNCKNPQVDLDMQVARVPTTFLPGSLLDVLPPIAPMHHSENRERQISKTQFKEILDLIQETEDARISQVLNLSMFANSGPYETASAQLSRNVVTGVQGFSILNPSSLKPLMRQQREGATLNVSANKTDDESVLLKGYVTFNTIRVSTGSKLPLSLGSNEIKIESTVPVAVSTDVEWSLPGAMVQVVIGASDANSKFRMLIFVKTSTSPPLLAENEKLTLKHVLKIKESLPAKPAQGIPVVRNDSPSDKVKTSASATSTKPLSLILQCGQVNEERSLNTKIGLADKASLTIEGEVESQQISVDGVEVKGENFVFKNEAPVRYKVDSDGVATAVSDTQAAKKTGLFSAKAANGSISFRRGSPLEETLRLSLQKNATLQFAGIEFSADSIECFPGRIEANGNVEVSIPEISSKVSAGRVIMNLKSLAFDFDGDVKVERNVGEDSFPFLVKGKHVGWSLVTGEMQTDQRHNQPRRAAGRTNGFTGGANPPIPSSGFGQSGFQQRQSTAGRFGNGGSHPPVQVSPFPIQNSSFSNLKPRR